MTKVEKEDMLLSFGFCSMLFDIGSPGTDRGMKMVFDLVAECSKCSCMSMCAGSKEI